MHQANYTNGSMLTMKQNLEENEIVRIYQLQESGYFKHSGSRLYNLT